MSALISLCGKYRYRLYRRVSEGAHVGRVLWVMLNPSTADGIANDNTIRRCISFTRSWGFGEFMVGNLYALRSPDPKALWRADDPVGPENIRHVADMASTANLIVAAWGAHAERAQADAVAGLLSKYADVWCLGLNKNGSPRHPLFLPDETQRVLLMPRARNAA